MVGVILFEQGKRLIRKPAAGLKAISAVIPCCRHKETFLADITIGSRRLPSVFFLYVPANALVDGPVFLRKIIIIGRMIIIMLQLTHQEGDGEEALTLLYFKGRKGIHISKKEGDGYRMGQAAKDQELVALGTGFYPFWTELALPQSRIGQKRSQAGQSQKIFFVVEKQEPQRFFRMCHQVVPVYLNQLCPAKAIFPEDAQKAFPILLPALFQ